MPTAQTTVSGNDRLSYSTKETAQCIREALKRAFPGVKFSIRTSYASMTSSTHVQWTDGPTQDEVERVTDRFTSKSFDGMTDSTNYHEQEFNGQRVQFSGWVNVRRELSPTLLQKAIDRFNRERAEYGLPAARLNVVTHGGYSSVDGPDVNAEAGINPCGYRYTFRYCSDAVQSIAHSLRPNGCRVSMKAVRS